MAKFGFWRAEGRLAALTAKLAAAGLVPEGRQVTGVSVAPGDRTRSGRARKVTLALDEGSQAADATAFRRALGLRSTLFKVENGGDGGAYALVGRGFGHGVGMSQVGAMTYAAKYAWDYRRILEFYYSGIQLCRDDGARCSPI
jgi:stage II sporulation protein D